VPSSRHCCPSQGRRPVTVTVTMPSGDPDAAAAPDHATRAGRSPQQEHRGRTRHQSAHGREPPRLDHEEDRLRFPAGAGAPGPGGCVDRRRSPAGLRAACDQIQCYYNIEDEVSLACDTKRVGVDRPIGSGAMLESADTRLNGGDRQVAVPTAVINASWSALSSRHDLLSIGSGR
jgi:hypothetical protein